jgi:hypothetical protein
LFEGVPTLSDPCRASVMKLYASIPVRKLWGPLPSAFSFESAQRLTWFVSGAATPSAHTLAVVPRSTQACSRMPYGKAAASAAPDVNGITNMTAESRGSFPAIMLAPPECPITQITTRGICPGGCRVLKVTGPW